MELYVEQTVGFAKFPTVTVMVAQLSSHWTGLWPDCFTERSVEHLVLQILSALLNLDLHKSWINVQVLSTLSN